MYIMCKSHKLVYTLSILIILLFLLFGLIIISAEILAISDSKGSCESEGLYSISRFLRRYAEENNGYLPDINEIKKLLPEKLLICNYSQKSYKWEKGIYNIYKKPPKVLAYCPHPHGVITKWRIVLFSNLKIQKIYEKEFKNIMAKQKLKQ